jgi:predicted transcriptional regulator
MSLGPKIVRQLLREVKEGKERKTMAYREKVRTVLELVIDSGMTQEEIAEELCLSQAQISRYITAQATPKPATVKGMVRLAEECQVEIPFSNGWAKN